MFCHTSGANERSAHFGMPSDNASDRAMLHCECPVNNVCKIQKGKTYAQVWLMLGFVPEHLLLSEASH